MSFLDTIRRAKAYLEEQGRVSLRALQREFDLDAASLDELVDELVEVQQVAVREGEVLSRVGAASTTAPASEAERPAKAPASAEAERRQLTVLFCDLVGSTELSQRLDAEDLRSVVRAYQENCAEVIKSLDGNVAQYLGDGLLVYFGYPQAHEDDAIRALRAGLRILEVVPGLNERLAERLPVLSDQPLQVRLGVHTGPVVVGELGSGEKREQLALGDTVNIAARLEAMAEPGSLLISDATRHLVRGAFLLEELGERTLKGIAKPVTVSRVVQPTGVQSRFDLAAQAGLTALVGREQEVALLLDRWQEAKEGQGQVVLLSGEAGMGKSRLVHVLRERVADQPHSWLEIRGSAYHQNSAFHPVLELIGQTLLLTPEIAPAEQIARLARGLEATGLGLRENLPLLASLLSLPLPGEFPPLGLSPEAERKRTLEGLCSWILALAEQQPLILVAEDLHWCDPSTLELFGMLLGQVSTARVLLLFTFRPTFEPPWPSRSHVVQLPLHPLTREQMVALVTNVAGEKTLPVEVVDRIVAKTDRVPLFIEELTKTVLESDLLVEKDDRFELRGPLPELAIPSTLQDSLMARLDRLGPGKEVAQLCAALGRDFSHELLEAVSPMEPDLLSQLVAGLASAELLYQRGVPPHAVYQFKHALIQEMAYQSLLRKTRMEYHARIARAFEERFPDRVEREPALIGRHYEEAGLTEQAIDAYRRAAELAKERSAYTEAIRQLSHAIELLAKLPDDRERVRRELALQVAIGAPLTVAKGSASAEAQEVFRRQRELCEEIGTGPELGAALLGLVAFHVSRSELETARELCDDLLRLAEREGEAALLSNAHSLMGQVLYLRGEPSTARRHMERAVFHYDPRKHRELLTPEGDLLGIQPLTWGAWVDWMNGFPDQALEKSRGAVALADEMAHPYSQAFALAWTAVLHFMRREREPGLEVAERAISIAEEQGFPVELGAGRLVRTWARVGSREASQAVDEAIAEIQDILAQLGVTGTQAAAPQILGGLADICLEFGRIPEAAGYVDAAMAVSAATKQPYFDADLHRIQGEVVLRQDGGDEKQAESSFRRAATIAAGQEARSLELRAVTSLARLLQRQGKLAEAREQLQPVFDGFSEGFDTQDLKDAKALLEEPSSP